MFLLSGDDQREVIRRVAHALKASGRFLFSAPRLACKWHDLQTGMISSSLGEDEYRRLLADAGLQVVSHYIDEGENFYFDAQSQTCSTASQEPGETGLKDGGRN